MKRDELDSILDAALASYSLREPRAGLPRRILARIESEPVVANRWWYLPAAVLSMIAVAAVAILLWPGERRPAQRQADTPVLARIVKSTPESIDTRQPAVARPNSKARIRAPRPESFPTPAPLTREERTLMALAREAPDIVQRLSVADKPLEIAPIEIRPLQIDGIETGEEK